MMRTKEQVQNRAELRVGIVGCGKVAQHHARFIQEQEGVHLVGVADVNQDAALVFAASNNVPLVKETVTSLLESAHLDVLHVVTPPAYHYPCARAALDRGVHVLLEKPMAFSAAEIADLYERATAAGVLLCPDFIHLFHPRMQQLLRTVESGKLGRPMHVETRLCIDLEEESPDLREALGMHWSYLLPGGLLRDYAAHALYMALYFAGWPKQIQVTKKSHGILPQGLPDHLVAQIDGAQCTATVLLSCGVKPSSLGLKLHCEKGTAEAILDRQTVLVRGPSALPRKIALATANFVDSWHLSTSAVDNIVNFARGKILPYGGLGALLPRFYAAIRNSDSPPVERALATAVAMAEETIFSNSAPLASRGLVWPSAQVGVHQTDKILVTGASGYIGTATVRALVREGYAVRALVRPTSSLETLKHLGVEIFLGDVRRFEDVHAAAEDMDVIVHLAAGLHGSPQFVVDSSAQGTKNVSRAALLQRVKRVIYMSSMSVYDVAAMKRKQTLDEDSPLEEKAETRGAYSLGKRCAEDVALRHLPDGSPAWTILRPSLVVGKGGDPVAPVGWMAGHNLLCLTSPRRRLLLIHVDDVAAAIVQIIQHEATKGKVYTLSHPDRIRVREYVQTCIRPQQGHKMRTIYVPYWCALLAVAASKVVKQVTHRGPSLNRRRLLSVYRNLNAGCDRLRQDTGWEPAAGLLERLGSKVESKTLAATATLGELTTGD